MILELLCITGDLWSYNATNDKFVVYPDPDICTQTVDLSKQKFIILASDGLWNMVSFQEAVDIVNELDPQVMDLQWAFYLENNLNV